MPSRSPLSDAAEALSRRWNARGGLVPYPSNSTAQDFLDSGDAQAAYDAILDSLIRELPERAVEVAAEELGRIDGAPAQPIAAEIVILSFLGALRDQENGDG